MPYSQKEINLKKLERIYQAISMAACAVNKNRVTYDDAKADQAIKHLREQFDFWKNNPSAAVAFYDSLMQRFIQAANETFFTGEG